ncbi:MAG: 5-oxoprolinase subunit PxpB [Flavobacteriaceae bacterium]|nr:5-oxoprolinase subunit PxpB [Flavobacteriaceae bacterium]
MKRFNLTYKPFGDHSILIEWPSNIDENILYDILSFKKILKNHTFKQKVYVKHAYNSILISYSLTIDNIYNEILLLKQLYLSHKEDSKREVILWKIPVCYDEKYGIDLDEITKHKSLSKSRIIALHSKNIYTVYFIGFLPGFLYLGGLNKKLKAPRKSIPRLHIKKGAVAIGGNQTGVYPSNSPGGWNIIGNTPINFFNSNSNIPCFAKAGDKIQFIPISVEVYEDILIQVKQGTYQIESEVIHA